VAAPDRVRVAAHAKLNLFLRILAREQSGYHQIETAFALLDLADELTVSRAPAGVTLAVQGATADLGPPEENLAVRAAHAVLEASGRRFGVAIELVKRIPVRAGLGGGSSDAAAALLAVNALGGDAVPRPELLHLATRLGADVAFLASGAPAAVAWGRGERLFRFAPPPAAPALVAVPPMDVATPDAYGWWDALYPPRAVPWYSTPRRSPAGAASAASAATTSRSRCSASTPRCAPCTSDWPGRSLCGCGCAARGARSPRCTARSATATMRR